MLSLLIEELIARGYNDFDIIAICLSIDLKILKG